MFIERSEKRRNRDMRIECYKKYLERKKYEFLEIKNIVVEMESLRNSRWIKLGNLFQKVEKDKEMEDGRKDKLRGLFRGLIFE